LTEKKPRVYQVAKDFMISSEGLIEILKDLGVKAKSHMSTVDPSVVELVRQRFQQEKEAVQAGERRKKEAAAEIETKVADEPSAKPAGKPAAAVRAKPTPAVQATKPKVQPAPPSAAAPVKPAKPVKPAESTPLSPLEEARQKAAPSRLQRSGRPFNMPGMRSGRGRRQRQKTDDRSARESVKQTLADISAGTKGKKYKKKDIEPTAVATEEHTRKITISELASVAELAEKLDVSPPQIITRLLGMGRMVTQNQRLDKDTIEIVALEFDYGVEFQSEYGAEKVEEQEKDKPEDLVQRPPVVTVMGHVDHGKTSLLDYVRKTNVIAGEKGGITQHIGAYNVELPDGRRVTFLDTPGHQAFTAMRARGAQATDIVVLVVAADDRVMPQTLEAIDHARAAGVPIIVAVNKIDKPEANLPMIKQDLANNGLLIEEYGGQVPSVDVSAKHGTNVDDLMELILLQADLLEVKANPDRRARGVVIESKIERGRGTVATILVQNGTLKVGDPFICGSQFGKVRAMADERGKRVKSAAPSTPVEVTGWSGPPLAGDLFVATATEADAREIGMERQLLAREQARDRRKKAISLVNIASRIKEGQVNKLRLIIKADVAGSVEVLSEQLQAIEHEEVQTEIIHASVGQINSSDVELAAASHAVIIGFNTRVDPAAQQAAINYGVDIKIYGIIYKVMEDVKSALEGLLRPEEVEREKATVEVRQVFQVSKSGTIAGCYVQSGTVERSHKVRVVRDGEVIHTGVIGNLKRFKDDVKEVAQGFECGISIEGFKDFKEGDTIQAFVVEEVARRLDA